MGKRRVRRRGARRRSGGARARRHRVPCFLMDSKFMGVRRPRHRTDPRRVATGLGPPGRLVPLLRSGTKAAVATEWPSSRFITRTPVASRPWEETSRTGVRMSTPPVEATSLSSSRRVMKAARGSRARPSVDRAIHPSPAALTVKALTFTRFAESRVRDHEEVGVVAYDVERDRLASPRT